MDKSKIVSIVVVIVVLVALGFFVFKGGKPAPTEQPVESVATVNGVVIPKANYETQLASLISTLKSQGQDVENADNLVQIKNQVLNDLINNELVTQGIKAAGITANPADVEKQVQDLITQTGGVEKFNEELVKANLTEAQLRENISRQLAVQAYLTANINVAGITVTDEEISQFYKEYSAAQKTASSTIKVPALKELSEQIKQQITSNKQQALINEFLASLQAKATIVKTQ